MGIKTDNMIFVFGSNLGGIHGAGAARYANLYRGARFGIGIGRTGQSYAIPTKGISTVTCDNDMHTRTVVGGTLPLDVIKTFVDEFIAHAIQHPEYQFQVTRIGCGLAGLKDEDIAPMFATAPVENVWFDDTWFRYLPTGGAGYPKHKFWGTF